MLKKISLLVAIIVFACTNITAQNLTIEPGQNFAHAGVGFGGFGYTNASFFPAIGVSYDRMLMPEIGPGYISVGGAVGFKSATYKYNIGNENFKDRWTNIFVGARALYHWDVLNQDKYDVYGGLVLGIRYYNYSYDGLGLDVSANQIYPWVGGVIGAQYFFTRNIGAYAEIGYSISYLNLGVSIKL